MPMVAAAAIAAAVSTGVGVAAAGIAGFTFLGLTGVAAIAASFAVSFAVSVGLGLLSAALAPKPKLADQSGAGSGNLTNQGRLLTLRSTVAVREFVYGTVRKSGVLVFAGASGDSNEYLHLVIAVAGHSVDAMSDFRLDANAVELDSGGNVNSGTYAGLVRIRAHLGLTDQAADSDLVAEIPGWTDQHRLRGIAYIYARLKWNADVWSGVPAISALVRGKNDIYIPSTGASQWTDNAAAIALDYLTHGNGVRATLAECNLASWLAAYNICDESVALPGGGVQNRYRADGIVKFDEKPLDAMTRLLTAMAGTVVYSQGEYLGHAGAYDTPTVNLYAYDLRGDIKFRAKPSKRELFNAVRGTYVDADTFTATDFPPMTNATYEAADGDEQLFRDIELPFTQDVYAAQRLAGLALDRARLGNITVEFPGKLTCWAVRVWDVINLTVAAAGWDTKPFRVLSRRIAEDGGIDLVLQEEDAAGYDWSSSRVTVHQPRPDTNLPSRLHVAAVAVAVSDWLVQTASGTPVTQLVIDVALPTGAGSTFVSEYEIQAKRTANSVWMTLAKGAGRRATLVGVSDGGAYDVRARAITLFGVRGPWTTVTGYIVVGQAEPPDDVAGFAVAIVGETAFLTWSPNADLDISHYRIRFSPATTGATWLESADLVAQVAHPSTATTAPAAVGTYLIKAVDLKGNESEAAAASVSTAAGVVQFNAVTTITEDPGFAGTKVDTVVNGSNQLVLDAGITFDDLAGLFDDQPGLFDDSGAYILSGTYAFANAIDLGAVYACRVSAAMVVVALDSVTLFDDRLGSFDSQDGLFDDSASGAACRVLLELRTTPDDPAGAPTWSSWGAITVGVYSARAFQFRATLTSELLTATPAIEELSVTVDMPDRVQANRNLTSAAGGDTITFASAFKSTPAIGITGNNMATGDYFAVTSPSATGFSVRFFNAAGTGIARTYDWIAKGF